MGKKDLTPQQQNFKEAYLSPKSPTFGNAYKSGLEAGYSHEYSKNITGQGNDWLSEILRDREMGMKAEKMLAKAIDDGLTSDDIQDRRLGFDSAKVVVKGMLKHKYSERTEHTGADGESLPTPILSILREENEKTDNKKG